jgi:endonuclease YncB( thermonuclease family)
MARIAHIAAFALAVAFSAGALGEVVRVTAKQTRLYDSEAKAVRTAKIEGKRFMVYAVGKDWYLIQLTISNKKVFRWIPKTDVEIDWGPTKTARVVKVHEVDTLELSNGDWVQFAGLVFDRDNVELTRRTLAWLRTLLEDKQVTLEYDQKPEKRRGYGLAYVYVGEMFVNRTILELGLARTPYSYANSDHRYADVFGFFVEQARKQGKGMWAGVKQGPEAEAESKPAEAEEETETATTETERQYVRHLSQAEKAQWARNLATEIQVTTKRTKDTTSEAAGSDSTTYTDEICWHKTIEITVKNGWGFALQGLTAKYDLFGKTGKTSDTVILHESGELTDMDLKPGETRLFKGKTIDFKGTESSETGWTGTKYYGYRVTFYYKDSPVKVVAYPSHLSDYGSGGTD